MRALGLAALLVAAAAPAGAQSAWPRSDRPGHPYDDPQPANAPDELMVVVEIPAGCAVKYEIDKVTGRLFVDRFQSMPVAAPANYGSIPRSLAPDGDPVDAVVLSRFPLQAGSWIRVRPVGVIRTVDGDVPDDKILAVPVSGVDPTYDGIVGIEGIPAMERERIAAYFRVYKQLPGRREGRIVETGGAGKAREALAEGFARYARAQDPSSKP
jgi:inorganic pyrophosphatase